jgi:retron-type reverse transcriptase
VGSGKGHHVAESFDAIDHGWLMKFVAHRIADPRILRLIRKWLRAGVSEDGSWSKTTRGTPQGSVISPLLANVYLHYVFDLWAQNWRTKSATGEMIFVRYADDFVMGFQHRSDAERCLQELRGRLAKFGLELHPDKTRLLEFGRFAAVYECGRQAPSGDFLGGADRPRRRPPADPARLLLPSRAFFPRHRPHPG